MDCPRYNRRLHAITSFNCPENRDLIQHGIIPEELKVDQDWLWGFHNRMHLFQFEDIEWLVEDYTVVNHNRAVRAFKEQFDILKNDN